MGAKRPDGFPFPLIIGPDESRYLTWLRNHSNYMAERGFLDYMRIVAVLVRGILVNFLTLLPYLLVGALIVGVLFNPMLDNWKAQGEQQRAHVAADDGEESDVARPDWIFPTRALTARPDPSPQETSWERIWASIGGWAWTVPEFLQTKLHLPKTTAPYLLTPLLGLVALAYFLLFPVVIRLFKVISHKKSLATGSGSSVKLRDKYERSFGGALIVVGGLLLIETLPLLIHNFHEARNNDWRGVLTGILGATSVLALSSAGKLMRLLGGLKQKLAMALVGLLGLLLPLIVVLYVSEFLIYDSESFSTSFGALAVIPVLLALGILGALVLGLTKGALGHAGWLLRLLIYVLLAIGFLKLLEHFEVLGGGWFFVLAIAIEIWLFCWLAVDVNLTSVHGLYRDRLASAYLVGEDTKGEVDIEEDIDLHDICLYQTFSTAPYHLINVAHNLQGSKDFGVRERNSDFFIFSKRFIGSGRTGYCHSEDLEKVFPQMDLATAMAISAAAAAPNMGVNTSRSMVALLTLLNVRLGYWVPNPGHIEAALGRETSTPQTQGAGLGFEEVFSQELAEVRSRWRNLASGSSVRDHFDSTTPSPRHGLIGIGFSGGGIRSATINLGIAQTLHRGGVFDQIDYMSTVSGGGYLGSSISTLMRTGSKLHSDLDGTAMVTTDDGKKLVQVDSRETGDSRTYTFRQDAEVSEAVEQGKVNKGEALIRHRVERGDLGDRFTWRVRPGAFRREMFSRLDETHKWVNLSDGGHLENLATIELLRRRCRFILIGDGEADRELHFGSLARLIRYARLDLGIRIDIDPREIRSVEGRSGNHFAVGRIRYPKETGGGYEEIEGRLLYLKSSFTGDEEEVIQQYRSTHPDFPHESTADQFFDEGQFEAYRSLGQHIGEKALAHAPGGRADLSDLVNRWLEGREEDREGTGAVRVRQRDDERRPTVTGFFDQWFQNLESALPSAWPERKESQ